MRMWKKSGKNWYVSYTFSFKCNFPFFLGTEHWKLYTTLQTIFNFWEKRFSIHFAYFYLKILINLDWKNQIFQINYIEINKLLFLTNVIWIFLWQTNSLLFMWNLLNFHFRMKWVCIFIFQLLIVITITIINRTCERSIFIYKR